jgi:uncharacterized protein
MDVDEHLARVTGFEWEAGNVEKNWQNWQKHQVSAADCEQVFFNQPLVAARDVAHSQQEPRWYVLGQTDAGRLLFLVFTLSGTLIRVISARDTSRKERKVYGSP